MVFRKDIVCNIKYMKKFTLPIKCKPAMRKTSGNDPRNDILILCQRGYYARHLSRLIVGKAAIETQDR